MVSREAMLRDKPLPGKGKSGGCRRTQPILCKFLHLKRISIERAMRNDAIGFRTCPGILGGLMLFAAMIGLAEASPPRGIPGIRAIRSPRGIQVSVGPGNEIHTIATGGVWTRQHSPTVSSLYDVTYGNEVFVGVGNEGAVVTSTDGVDWSLQSAGTDERLRAIAFDGRSFVAVGYAGTIVSSSDGKSWSVGGSGTRQRLQDICHAQGRLVAVGWHGTILTSTNGTRWVIQKSGTAANLRSVAYESGLFVATGDEGVVLASKDGVTWKPGLALSSDVVAQSLR
jgi:hypothetical protein